MRRFMLRMQRELNICHLPRRYFTANLARAKLNLANLRYADDTALIAESESELQKLVDRVKEESEVKA